MLKSTYFMVKKLLLLYAFVMIAIMAKAQTPQACGSNTDPPSEDCETSCIYCNFNGMSANTGDYSGGGVPSFCQSIQNDMWLGFIAGTASATFTITPTNCSNGDGVQVALYGGCGEPFIACNGGQPGGGSIPVSITTALTPGTNYYLLIDGYSGDACDVSISVVPPAAVQAPPSGIPTSITGPATVCPGSTASYTAGPANLTGVGFYEWSGPPGCLINGLPSPVILDAPGGRTVQITFPSSNVPLLNQQICVTTSNSCFAGGTRCRTVNIVPIPKRTLTPKKVCNEDAPYTLPWGDDAFINGTYSHTYTSYQGCDSVVEQMITILPAITKNIGTRVVCAGGSINVCGNLYDVSGPINETCTSFLGCDSLVFGNFSVLNPVANILGGGVLSCSTSSITLTASITDGNTIWRNQATGALLSSTPTLVVTAPGTYVLTSSQTQSQSAPNGPVTCSKADTIIITGNTTPPTVAASTVGVIGCTTTSATLNATSNATGATFTWVGPAPFTATGASVTAGVAGTYTVTARNPANGCTATTTTTVTGNTTPPTASATGGIITCATPSISLGASSNVPTATYLWSGPGTFTPSASVANPAVSTIGTYTVEVTDPGSGCKSTTTATVTNNITPPAGTASVSGPISCLTPNVTLNAATAAASPSYTWTGPVAVAPVQSPMIGTAGTYTVTILSAANGCTSTATVNVTGNTNVPNSAAVAGTVNCGQPSLTLTGSSTTPGVTYGWTGPNGFTANTATASATVVGTYTLTVTAANNCTSTQTAEILGDFAVPNASATGGMISCAASSAAITGSSTTPGATFLWAGPGNFTSTQATENVSGTGVYTLTVEAPNGCTATATATVSPDANVPNAAATGGLLNCSIDTITLSGSSTTPGTNLSWSGPNGFTSLLPNPMISQPGTYTLTVSNPANGCSGQATATVILNNTTPGAAAIGGTLTCASPNFTLQGNSATAGVTWAWTGPNMYTSTAQNPVIGVDGVYNLVVTNPINGCQSTASATVQADQNAPQAAATTAQTLTCALLSTTVSGTSTQPGTFAWTGPAPFTSVQQNPTVTEPGLYTLTVQSANGCTDVASVTVLQDIAPPDLAGTTDTISCTNPQGNIAVITTAPNPTYQWTGPNNFSATSANPTVPAAGNYLVTITGGNGCQTLGTISVGSDEIAPVASATAPTTLTCALTTVGIQSTATNASSAVQTFDWTGPNGYASTVEDPADITAPGVYTLTVTSLNGCTSTTQATVLQNIAPPNISAVAGTVTCLAPSIPLDGGSTSVGSTFAWTGPNGFAAVSADTTASDPGAYTLTVTGTNGCTSTQTATVLEDKVLPGAAAVSTNDLDCDDLQTTLQGTSPTNAVTYGWTGPNNFTATIQNVQASAPGTYNVTTLAANGCTSTATVDVLQDIIAPGATALGDTIDCISGQAPLTAASTTGVSYNWTGPNNYTSPLQNPIVTVNGTYTVVATGANGCTSSATALIAQNTDAPQATISGGGTLTCTVTDLTLTGTISTPGATGVWSTGETTATITISTPAIYTYTVTAVNGCKFVPAQTISQNIQTPQAVTASNGQVDCNTPTISIAGNSSTTGVLYSWTGPGGYISSVKSPNDITNPGDYILVVTNPVNGCTETATSTVTQDPTVPDILVTTDTITCKLPSVVLNATSVTPNVTFKWSGPGGYTSTLEDPNTTVPGTYSVIAKATSGCTATYSIVVEQNKVPPTATATGDTITCFTTTGTLLGNSTTPGVTYLWTGNGGFTSTSQNPTVTLTGNYTLVVTGPNGCTSSTSAVVSPDANAPQISAVGGTVTCAIPGITLNATSNVAVAWLWNGPNGFTSTQEDPAATVAGNYTVRATAANGCSVTTGTTVLADTQGPVVNTATPDELNCTTTQVALGATVAVPGSYTFAWTTQNGNIVSGLNTPSPTVSQGGNYSVIVTNLINGCTTLAGVAVIVDPATPSFLGRKVRDVSCFGDTNGAIVADSVAGGTPPFLYSIDNQPFTASFNFTGLPPGPHTIIVQDANGCELVATDVIGEPEELIVNLGLDTTIHLGNTLQLTLDDIVNYPDRVVQRIVKPADLIVGDTLKPTYSFRYTVTVIDANGCKASDERVVIVDKKRYIYVPNVFYPESINGNNLLMIYGGEDVEKITSFQVFDRWGESVHEAFNFQPNDPSQAWDGRIRGNKVAPTVYVFYAKVLFKDGETEIFKGDVTLYR